MKLTSSVCQGKIITSYDKVKTTFIDFTTLPSQVTATPKAGHIHAAVIYLDTAENSVNSSRLPNLFSKVDQGNKSTG
jgi:hypothetical protein